MLQCAQFKPNQILKVPIDVPWIRVIATHINIAMKQKIPEKINMN